MTGWRKSLVSALVVAGLSWGAGAQELIQHASGFSTRAPQGFKVTRNQEGAVVVDPAETYMVVVKSHNYANFEAFAADANLARDGFALVGEVQATGDNGRMFRAAKATAQGNLIADTFVNFSPYGGGSLIVALSNDRSAEAAYYNALNMASQVQFERSAPAAAGNSPWDAALRGKHLLYLYTASGFSERTDLFLRRDGSFVYRRNSSSLSANGSGYAAGNSDGNWSVTPAGQLLLRFQNGNVHNYTLSPRQAGNEVGLNGKRWFVMQQ